MSAQMMALLVTVMTFAVPVLAGQESTGYDLEGNSQALVPVTVSEPAIATPSIRRDPIRATVCDPSMGVFENWRGSTIRSDRWYATSSRAHELRREIQGNHLVMRLRLEGSTDRGNTGFAGASQRMFAANAARIDRLEATFQIRSSTLIGCLEHQVVANTRVRPAGISLALFNDGSSTGPEDATGDYFVRVLVNREAVSDDPPDVFTVQAFLFRCMNAACTTALSSIYDVDLGRVRANHPFTLRLAWDAPAARVFVGFDDRPDATLLYDPLLNAGDAVIPFADLIGQSVSANCTAGPTVSDSEIAVRRVRTNWSAVIP